MIFAINNERGVNMYVGYMMKWMTQQNRCRHIKILSNELLFFSGQKENDSKQTIVRQADSQYIEICHKPSKISLNSSKLVVKSYTEWDSTFSSKAAYIL